MCWVGSPTCIRIQVTVLISKPVALSQKAGPPSAPLFSSTLHLVGKEVPMTSVVYVGVDVHRKDNHFHCLDPTGQTIATFQQRNNRPGTERAIAQLTTLLQQGRFDELPLAAEATNWYWLA